MGDIDSLSIALMIVEKQFPWKIKDRMKLKVS